VLGSKTEIFLLLILSIPTLLVPSFAEDDSLIVETDKAEYEKGDSMVISGHVGEIKMPVVALKRPFIKVVVSHFEKLKSNI